MGSDVTEGGSPKERICDCMGADIGIGSAGKSSLGINHDSAENERRIATKGVYVKTKTGCHGREATRCSYSARAGANEANTIRPTAVRRVLVTSTRAA